MGRRTSFNCDSGISVTLLTLNELLTFWAQRCIASVKKINNGHFECFRDIHDFATKTLNSDLSTILRDINSYYNIIAVYNKD